jgi:hypothetical protein
MIALVDTITAPHDRNIVTQHPALGGPRRRDTLNRASSWVFVAGVIKALAKCLLMSIGATSLVAIAREQKQKQIQGGMPIEEAEIYWAKRSTDLNFTHARPSGDAAVALASQVRAQPSF